MIRWCAYCQKFLGEKEPRSDFCLTHGICAQCRAAPASHRTTLAEAARPIIEFYEKLRSQAVSNELPSARELLEASSSIGISPLDLTAGIMQPLLSEIAHLQQKRQATIRQEHAFSKLVSEILIETERSRTPVSRYGA
jgi:hypothetical protein